MARGRREADDDPVETDVDRERAVDRDTTLEAM